MSITINNIATFHPVTGWSITATNNLSLRSAAIHVHGTDCSQRLLVSIFQHIERDSFKDYFVLSHDGRHYSVWGKVGSTHASLEIPAANLGKTFNARANNGYTFIGTALIAPPYTQAITDILSTLRAVMPLQPGATAQPIASATLQPIQTQPTQVVAPQPSRPYPNRKGSTRGRSVLPRTQAGFDVLSDPRPPQKQVVPRIPKVKPVMTEQDHFSRIHQDEADENIL